MHRLTVYLTDELYAAVVAHAEAAGQKLSTFVGRELAHLVDEPTVESAGVRASRYFDAEAMAKRKGRLIAEANAKRAARS